MSRKEETSSQDTNQETQVAAASEPELLPAPLSDEVLDEVAEKIRNLQRMATLDLAMSIGKIIVGEVYGGDLAAWRSRGAKDASFRKLAARDDLGLSRSSLQRSVAIYEMSERLGVSTWRHLGVSHLRTVLGLPEEQQRGLLTEAEDAGWTVEKMLSEAAKLKKPDGRGRPTLPAFVKAIGKLDRIADDRDSLFGDLDKLDDLSLEEAEKLYQKVVGVKLACEDLQQRLVSRVPGLAPPS